MRTVPGLPAVGEHMHVPHTRIEKHPGGEMRRACDCSMPVTRTDTLFGLTQLTGFCQKATDRVTLPIIVTVLPDGRLRDAGRARVYVKAAEQPATEVAA